MSARFHPYLCGRNAAEWLICMSEFITGCCRLISSIFDAVFSEPLLAFFMTVMLVAVVAGLFLYIYRGTKRL